MQRITPGKTYRTVVPLHKELAKGTLFDILHQTGLSRDDLEELLKLKTKYTPPFLYHPPGFPSPAIPHGTPAS